MAQNNLPAENLAQAYSVGNWEYTNYDPVYAGAVGSSMYASALRFYVPDFVGISEALEAALVCNLGDGRDVTLRWAICTSDENRTLYANTNAEVEDTNQIASGIITISDTSSDTQTEILRLFTTKIKGGNTYYLFLWAYNDTGLSIRAVSSAWGNHSISIGYNIGAFRIKTFGGVKMFSVYMKLDNDISQMIPYIRTPSGLKPGS